MDNARVHSSVNSLKFYRESKVRVINKPSNSPHLNPIENYGALKKIR